MFSLFIFFLCRLSVWCLFFCYQWPKSCSPFIHTWQMWVVCLSMCRVPEFFFANILLISSLNVLIIIVYLWRMLGKERAATLYSLWLYCIVVFFFIIVNHFWMKIFTLMWLMYDHDECKKLHSTSVCLCVCVCVCVCVIMMLRLKEWHERDKCYVSLRYNRQVCFLFRSHMRSPSLSSEKRVEACVYIMKPTSRG